MSSKSGGLLFEKFEILDTLKKDSHSAVYLAMHTLLGKEIILKTLNTASIPDPTIVERFKREGKLLARLDHPNIIKILDFGSYRETLYISFEYFRGLTLREMMQQQKLTATQKRSVFMQLLSGLEAAHQEKIIHRDLKPENILLDDRQMVKIADFGLASSELEVTVTNKSSILGTPGYMSPEQIYGERLTVQSDIFSIGVIGYELFTGNNPFLKTDISATVNAIMSFNDSDLVFTADCPKDIELVIKSCMRKNKKERAESIASLFPFIDPAEVPLRKQAEITPTVSNKLPWLLVAGGITVIIMQVMLYIKPGKNYDYTKTNAPSVTDTISWNDSTDKRSVSDTMSRQQITAQKERVADAGSETKPGLVDEKKSTPSQENVNAQAYLRIGCSPWAMVYVDNVKIDVTPLNAPVNTVSGTHTVRLEHPDYPPYSELIELKPGETKTIQVNLEYEFSSLDVKVLPWGSVFLNGSSYGETPFKKPLKLKPGNYVLKINNPGYEQYSENLQLKKGDKISREIRLQSKSN